VIIPEEKESLKAMVANGKEWKEVRRKRRFFTYKHENKDMITIYIWYNIYLLGGSSSIMGCEENECNDLTHWTRQKNCF
jgi:hypothetical protein